MKLFVSADIEGVSGIVDWTETNKNHSDYRAFQLQMTNEVKAAAEGALKSGAKEIIIKDAHDSARNIIHELLPKETELINGWYDHPYGMMEGLDESFDGAIFIGYHCGAGFNGNPLAHTISGSKIRYIKLNDELASEFKLNYYTALSLGVPVIFVSGDSDLIKDVNNTNPNIKGLAVKEGIGAGAKHLHPVLVEEKIKEIVADITKDYNKELFLGKMPEEFKVEICYNRHTDAYKASFYPNVKLKDNNTIEFTCSDYFEALRMKLFLI